MKFYSLYSKSQGRFNTPFLAEDDGAAIEIVSKMVSAQGDMALMSSLDDLQIERVGGFDPKPDVYDGMSPVFELLGGVVIVLSDLHNSLPLPPTIRSRLAKFYEIKAEEKALDKGV